jgi:hypothetical protein
MRFFAALLAAALLTSVAPANVTREQALTFQKKLDQIVQNSETPSDRTRLTVVTEGEVNSYLHFSTDDTRPVGVTEPSIGIEPDGRLNGRAVVDLDEVRRKKGSGGWFDPMSYLTGRLPVTARGVLQTEDGRGRFTLEAAAVSGIPVPKSFLQELVSHYTRTPDDSNGINIDDPFELPANIQKIDVQQGRATITQ